MSDEPITKPAAKRTVKKTAKKKAKRAVKRGYMGSGETVPLAVAAREAFAYQLHLGNIDDSTKFDDWRREQVREQVGRNGLTDCLHEHFKPLMAHFQILAGKDAEAFASSMQTGPATRQEDDTHEARRILAHVILEKIAAHVWLADCTALELAEKIHDTPTYVAARARREAIKAHDDGAIREGYVVHLMRQKTRRPDLKIGPDLKATLAERCTVEQLTQIRDTVVNRINAREGIQESLQGRNKKQKTRAEKERRSVKTLAPRFELPDDLPEF